MDIFCKFLFLDPPYIADERGGGGEVDGRGDHRVNIDHWGISQEKDR